MLYLAEIKMVVIRTHAEYSTFRIVNAISEFEAKDKVLQYCRETWKGVSVIVTVLKTIE